MGASSRECARKNLKGGSKQTWIQKRLKWGGWAAPHRLWLRATGRGPETIAVVLGMAAAEWAGGEHRAGAGRVVAPGDSPPQCLQGLLTLGSLLGLYCRRLRLAGASLDGWSPRQQATLGEEEVLATGLQQGGDCRAGTSCGSGVPLVGVGCLLWEWGAYVLHFYCNSYMGNLSIE